MSVIRLNLLALGSLAMLAAPVPAFADDTAAKSKAKDPNEMICISEPDLGSRLVRHKQCLTRAQWDERKRSDHESVDQAQRRFCSGAGC